MKRNPKTVAGFIGIVILAAGLVVILCLLIPTWRDADREAGMTPTPLPPVPASVRMVTRDPSLPTPGPMIGKGSKGEEVKKIQRRLQDLGYYEGTIDGEFGPQTETAVMLFQEINGLEQDGIAGDETRTRLYSNEAIPYAMGK